MVDLRGIGPLISSMPWRRDSRYATGPVLISDFGLRIFKERLVEVLRNCKMFRLVCQNSFRRYWREKHPWQRMSERKTAACVIRRPRPAPEDVQKSPAPRSR